MSKKFRFLSCLIAVFALALMAVSPVAFAGPNDKANDKASENAGKGSEQGQGKPASDEGGSSTSDDTVTEDNDDDGHPNSPDPEGDTDNKHPSGKDKHEEAGGSGNQGKATSDPDDDGRGPDRTNGGMDQPGGSGGADQLDQDGNNGCGNDDDFEDDNEGLCLGPVKRESVESDTQLECPDGSEMPASGNVEDCEVEVGENPSLPEDDVLGERIQRDEQPAQPAPSVLGVRLSPALSEPVEVAGAVLPFTGGDALIFLAAGMALIGAGVLALRFRGTES